ncbi:MAG: HAMP domain-containing histidine kinase [Saprospiraceae bacterium]|nr:HAMP domain-containing histidine kinase [Saprospiraceae bacterium]
MTSRLAIAAFFIFSSFLLIYSNRTTDPASSVKKLESYLNESLHKDSIIIRQYLNSEDDRIILNQLAGAPYFIEVYRNDSIIYWTDRTEINELYQNDLLHVQKIGDSINYSEIRMNLSGWSEGISPNLLSKAGIREKLYLSPNNESGYKINISLNELNIDADTRYEHVFSKSVSWWSLFLTMVLFSVLLLKIIKQHLLKNKTSFSHIIYLLVGILGFKLLNNMEIFTSLFTGYHGFELLNKGSAFTPTLADLVINLWGGGTLIYLAYLILPTRINFQKNSAILAFATGFVTLLLFGISVHLIEGFVLSSVVNLEIEALLQFNGVSFALIICFSLLMILIFQSTQLMYEYLHKSALNTSKKYTFLSLGWLAALCLIWCAQWLHVPLWIFVIFVISYSLILDAYVENKEQKITYLIWWLIMFSGFLAVCLFYFGLKKDINTRTEFLNQYYIRPDDSIIRSLVEIHDSLIKSDIFSKIASLDAHSKLDKHDLEQFMFEKRNLNDANLESSLELFDKKGNTLFNNHFANYHKIYQSYKNATQISKNLYHNPFEDKYILRLQIAPSTYASSEWYLFIIHQHTNNLRKRSSYENATNFGYVVFSQGKLISKIEANQSTPDISLLQSVDSTQIKDGYSFVVLQPSSQYKIVSFKKVSGLIKPISLFSFIFTLCGLILLFLSLINTKYDFLPENISLKFGTRSSLKTKIQVAIILLILVTFLIIGAITGYYFKNLIEVNQKNKNKQEASSINHNIVSDIQHLPDDESALTLLNTKLKEYSFVHDKELSLYDKNGRLVGSSINGINPMRIPFAKWAETKNVYGNVKTSVDFKALKTDYFPVFLNENNPLAYVGIAHKSYHNSSGNILDFLSTILNAYIFLFLIAGAMAITIANSITQPLSILAEKLKKFKLGKTNELLEWNSHDEIGTLIHDYNNLTHELERSAGIIAKTERDMAWREMAKQVAHEIKNPLTPMKLSIQYLDRTAKDYPDKAQDLIPRISATLIEQIDNLTQIANEFSNFATMPQASNEKIILNEIVETIHDLFRKRDDMEINMIEPIDDLYVFADKNHLVRILNNLLKNAIQSIPESRRGKIEIELSRNGNNAIIRISDNGTGIPDQMKDKVFTPNFTTKSSGTGLGLAISANMIESFNGKIYFETKVDKGTDFYISIPLMRLDDYLGNEQRVSLD